MKHLWTTIWMACILLPLATFAEESKDEISNTSSFSRLEYSHSLGNPNYTSNETRNIGFGNGAVSSLTLNFGGRFDLNAIYAGIGYQWLAKLQQNGIDLNQSANKIVLQLGYERTLIHLGILAPLIGFSLQYLPGLLSTHPDEIEEPNAIQFQSALGFKTYVGADLPFNFFVHLGYQMMMYNYEDGPAANPRKDFELYFRGAYFALGIPL